MNKEWLDTARKPRSVASSVLLALDRMVVLVRGLIPVFSELAFPLWHRKWIQKRGNLIRARKSLTAHVTNNRWGSSGTLNHHWLTNAVTLSLAEAWTIFVFSLYLVKVGPHDASIAVSQRQALINVGSRRWENGKVLTKLVCENPRFKLSQ